jgi:hypothetical protein
METIRPREQLLLSAEVEEVLLFVHFEIYRLSHFRSSIRVLALARICLFKILPATHIQALILCIMTLYSVGGCRRFGETCCLSFFTV